VIDRARVADVRGSGIAFTPNGPAKLIVTDSIITGNRDTTGAGAGILVNPQTGGSAEVALERVKVVSNAFGIAFDGTGSTAGINATIADSLFSANTQDGIIATTPSGGAPIGVLVTNTRSVNNTGFGIRSIGPGVTVRVEGSKVSGNSTGLGSFGGGALLSAGNNIDEANGANGAFSGALAFK
jgi:hypothetical protein